MKQPRYRLVLTGLTFAIAFSVALVATAQVTDTPGAVAAPVAVDSAAQATQARVAQSPIPAEFGVASASILQIGVAAFHGRNPGATLTYLGSGLSQPNITGYNYWTPISLPEGALIQYLDLYACDTNASSHITATLSGYSGSSSPATNDYFSISSITGTGNGCQYRAVGAPAGFTINNNVEYSTGNDYVVNVSFGATDGSNLLKGVDIWWKRQVSPAPVSASFGDVPTSHPYFQFIEALRASGITTGCGSGANYCPGDPLTRGQMAVFLAKALGLNWPL